MSLHQDFGRPLCACTGLRGRRFGDWKIARANCTNQERSEDAFRDDIQWQVFICSSIELLDGEDGSVTLCQRRYVDDILKRFGMEKCKAVASPVDVSSRLVSSNAPSKVDVPFSEAVGALMHLTTATRPEIAYAVSFVSRFMKNPQEEH
uniref:Reverse transcriptase Ty1/copia-type domain-containing protein n=1 Tax=Peronospora matthiolae TaxID=2874970 RepID=A0AAV1TTF2_9STRA